MSGREVLRLLRIGRRVPEVPVLVVTGMDVDNAYFAPWPILGVLRKPIALDELLATVARAVPLPRKRR
jgi:DNA-binding response OmpR family regulator